MCVLFGVLATRETAGVVSLPRSEGTEIDVTFFPGLTNQYEDAVSFGEWHRFLEEEKEEVEREEEVIVRLLQEEHNLNLDEPIEFTTQKRVMKQFSDLKKQQPSPDYLSSPYNEKDSYVTVQEIDEDILGSKADKVSLESLQELKPSDIVLLQPEKKKYVAYDVAHDAPITTTGPRGHRHPSEQQKRIKDLEYAFEHPKIDAVPDATISRLLSVTPPDERETERNIRRHQQERHRHAMRHNTEGHTEKKNKIRDHKERQQFLFHRLLEKQQLISPEDLTFLLGSNQDGREDERDPAPVDGSSHKRESLEDWEEDYEYDAWCNTSLTEIWESQCTAVY